MRLLTSVAVRHLLSRKRPTLVSLTGVVLGVAFFLAVSSLMRGSERDFIKRLIDNSPHITVYDEYRKPRRQPAAEKWPDGAVSVHSVKPLTEVRGIRGYAQKLEFIETIANLRAAPILTGSVVLSFAGRLQAVALNGIVPAKMKTVSTLEDKFIAGSMEALDANPSGVVIGEGLLKKFGLQMGENLDVVAVDGTTRVLKIVGVFRTGNASYDDGQVFALLKRVQVLLDRPNRVNRLVLQLDDAYAARPVASRIEARIGYKAVSWIEASEDIMNVLFIRNLIMYSVVSAILVVAAFGIYNTISTIVMEKTRDIAILKSMGFHARDVRQIFLTQGAIVGSLGSILGVLAGSGLMGILQQIMIKAPGATEAIHLPIYWGIDQYALAACFAMASALLASFLPARKGGRVHPVDILRGAA